MLAELEPWEIAHWKAARETIPLDDGWKQAGTIAATFHNEVERYCAGKAGKKKVDDSRLHDPEKYIPRVRLKKPKRIEVNQASIDLTQKILESQFLG